MHTSLATDDATATTGCPIAPTTLEEAGLGLDLTLQLTFKTLHFSGELPAPSWRSGWASISRSSSPPSNCSRRSTSSKLSAAVDVGRAAYRYRITDAGRARAILFLESNQYVGDRASAV